MVGNYMGVEEQRTLVLGVLLKRIGNFDLSTFKGRLVLQKTVYLLQSYGINLGYKFSWYIHGPYSPDLTKDAFRLQKVFPQIPMAEFGDKKVEKCFEGFLNFVGEKKKDGDWLEQLACTHFLKVLNPEEEKTEVIHKVLKHEYHFTKEQCQKAWDYLEQNNLIS
jgi:uncharacterized protein YwgA